MEVKNIISSSAKAIRVIDLSKGTIYKRVLKDYSDNYSVVYGIVLDILNGTETFIDVVEVKKSYGDAKFEFIVIGDKSDLNLYPATQEEITEYFAGVEDSIKRSIETAQEELVKKEKSYKMFQDLVKGNFAQISDTKFEALEAVNS